MRSISLKMVAILLLYTLTAVAEEKRPNVLILMADQLRYQSFGLTDPRAITPNIDRLASEGMLFENFVASTPVCSAFRGSLMTGKYASSTGIVVNELRMNPNHDTFAHVLKLAGYRTDHIGKWHIWAHKAGGHGGAENNYVPPGPYRMGFDDFWAAYNFGHHNFSYSYWTDSPKEIHVTKQFKPTHFSNLAIKRLEQHAQTGDPFAMVVAYSPPHDPFSRGNAPPEFYKPFAEMKFPLPSTWSDLPDPYMDRNTNQERWLSYWKPNLENMMRAYYAMTSALDHEVGRVMQTLKDTGLDRDTIVIFISDHGEMFGAQGRVYKMTFYEESARTPCIIRWPGNIPAGQRSDACMATPDVMPTILGLCGQKIPQAVEGMDLSQIALGKKGPEPEFALLQGMGHTYLWLDGFEWRAIRNKQYTYARYLRDGKELLFDNKNDPTQSKDLAASPKHQEKLRELREKMNKKLVAIHDDFQKCSWYRDNWTEDRVIMRSGPGPLERELGETIEVDVNYTGVQDQPSAGR
jgi:arylsulfatase A-like enzyme